MNEKQKQLIRMLREGRVVPAQAPLPEWQQEFINLNGIFFALVQASLSGPWAELGPGVVGGAELELAWQLARRIVLFQQAKFAEAEAAARGPVSDQ